MIPSDSDEPVGEFSVYQRGWMIDSQPHAATMTDESSISKGMDD